MMLSEFRLSSHFDLFLLTSSLRELNHVSTVVWLIITLFTRDHMMCDSSDVWSNKEYPPLFFDVAFPFDNISNNFSFWFSLACQSCTDLFVNVFGRRFLPSGASQECGQGRSQVKSEFLKVSTLSRILSLLSLALVFFLHCKGTSTVIVSVFPLSYGDKRIKPRSPSKVCWRNFHAPGTSHARA